MKITLDTDANALYVYIVTKEERKALDRSKHETEVHSTADGMVLIDKNGKNEILGIEFVPNTKIEIVDITSP